MFVSGKTVVDCFENVCITYPFYGRLSEMDFLKRIYDLKKMPSYDSRFENAEDDIWQHTINNDDYEKGWVFEDKRFGLMNGEDQEILKFLCVVFHPAVRNENGYWKEFLNAVNELLRNDGYELYPESKLSGRDVYGWRTYDPDESILFIPFSMRHEKEIKAKHITQSLSKKARTQIYALLERYNTMIYETDETGWQYNISTSESVFRDISQFYKPKCFNTNNEYVETDDMEAFILSTSPFCVFDVVEFYEKYNTDNKYAAQMNVLFKLNDIQYKLEQGRIECTIDVSIKNKDVLAISEVGLKDLILEAQGYYNKGNKQIAVEKLWDAFERLKTYYSPSLNKAQSANKIIDNMSGADEQFKTMYKSEFTALTDIGNRFRIRHHETTKVDITDDRQYDYFYKRCLSLISVAILYLEGGLVSEI